MRRQEPLSMCFFSIAAKGTVVLFQLTETTVPNPTRNSWAVTGTHGKSRVNQTLVGNGMGAAKIFMLPAFAKAGQFLSSYVDGGASYWDAESVRSAFEQSGGLTATKVGSCTPNRLMSRH
jgi:hypothetical protein